MLFKKSGPISTLKTQNHINMASWQAASVRSVMLSVTANAKDYLCAQMGTRGILGKVLNLGIYDYLTTIYNRYFQHVLSM